jgi:ribosomal protein S18 acetylase RimI-like enzyme
VVKEGGRRSVAGTASLVVRRGELTDASAISLFAARIFHESFAADNRPEDMAMYMAIAFGLEQQRRELSDAAQTYLIAQHGREIAGYALVRADGETPDCVMARPSVEIVRFYVDRPWHGKGVATMLMRACEAEARRRSARAMWLGVWAHNVRAIGFYTKSGFRDVGSHDFVLGTDVQTDRIMAREVDPEERTDR